MHANFRRFAIPGLCANEQVPALQYVKGVVALIQGESTSVWAGVQPLRQLSKG